MKEILVSWLALSWGEKAANAIFLLVVLYILGWSLLKFLKSIKKGSHVKISKEGIEVGKDEAGNSDNSLKLLQGVTAVNASINPEGYNLPSTLVNGKLSDTEKKLISLLEDLRIQKEQEVSELQKRLVAITNNYNELDLTYRLRCQDEVARLKSLIPIHQHELFNLLSAYSEPDAFLPILKTSKDRLLIIHAFFNDCYFETIRVSLLEFVLKLEQAPEDQKMTLLYDLPNILNMCHEKWMVKSKTIRVQLSNKTIYGIPEKLIQRYNQTIVTYLAFYYDKIRSILFSSFYQTWQMRVITILDLTYIMVSILTLSLDQYINYFTKDIELNL